GTETGRGGKAGADFRPEEASLTGPEQSDYLEATTDYSGADEESVVPAEAQELQREVPPFEKMKGAEIDSPFFRGKPGTEKRNPETSTAVIVNYLDDKDDGLMAAQGDEGDLNADDDLDLDLLEYDNAQVLRARPMIPVPREPR
ncbi:MAG: hypothetical protein LBF41_06400, partial [Deltaproteobacteria bacterium]|nr:hypothetical protein [Deltaproteobacteria bacterium]